MTVVLGLSLIQSEDNCKEDQRVRLAIPDGAKKVGNTSGNAATELNS